MRRAALLKQPPGARRQIAESLSLPAPVGGWNARDSVAAMDPRDALRLENWFPTTGDVRLRKGWSEHVTGIGSQVESLMPYNEANGTETLFAAAGTDFYDVTSSGTVGGAVVSSLTNARWQHVNYMNSSGTAYLCCFNGTDDPRYWEGTSWHNPAPTEITTSSFQWTASGSGTNEYYLEASGGGDPGINEPDLLYLNQTAATAGTLGSLADHEWAWGDNDTLGFDTVYFADSSGDPDTSGVTLEAVETPGIIGIDPSKLDSPWIHKRRMWMVESDSLSAWYLPVDAVGGVAEEFDLAGLFKSGGYLVAGGTWTIDAGEGMDDYWVVISSEGEVAVYQGTDPSAGSTWAIQGIYRIGEPIGKRCLMKYAGDLLVICRDGVYPLSDALRSSQVTPQVAITDKIRGAMTQAAERHKGNFGWELSFYPSGEMIILNVPNKEGSDQEQYVMNTITRAWGRFQGIEANCWGISGGEPYFGGDGFVGQFWSSLTDNDISIDSDLKQAFSYFGDRSGLKRWTMVRPLFRATTNPSITLGLNVDYDDEEPTGSLSFTPLSFGLWDSATWDSSIWGGGLIALTNWQTVNEYGTCAALRMKLQGGGVEVRFQAADYVFERGAVI